MFEEIEDIIKDKEIETLIREIIKKVYIKGYNQGWTERIEKERMNETNN